MPVEWAEGGMLCLDAAGKVVHEERLLDADSDGGEAALRTMYAAPDRYDASVHVNTVVRVLCCLSGSSLAKGLRALRLEGLSLMPDHIAKLASVFPNVRRIELGVGCRLGGALSERGSVLVHEFKQLRELQVREGAAVSAQSVLCAFMAAQQQRQRVKVECKLRVELSGELLRECQVALERQLKAVLAAGEAVGSKGARVLRAYIVAAREEEEEEKEEEE
eukprot:1139421-Pelagomonas_calceolata.AAC.4